MIYIFAPSYQTVLFSLHQFSLDEITFVTNNPSIKALADKLAIPVIYMEPQTDLSIQGYKDYKKLYLETIEGWKDREIFFSFYCYDVWGLMQLLKLRKKNKVSFYNTDCLSAPGFNEATSIYFPTENNSLNIFFNKQYRKIFIRQKLLYYITSIRFDIIRFEKDNYGLGIILKRIRKKFLPLKKQFNEALFLKNRETILASVKLPAVFDILFVDSGSNEIEYSTELTDTLKYLVSALNLTLIVKPHPTFALPQSLRDFPQIDRSIPIELIDGIPSIVMGLASNALINLGKTNFTVSLVNLVKFKTIGTERIFKNIVSFENNIHKPATIEELKELITKRLE